VLCKGGWLYIYHVNVEPPPLLTTTSVNARVSPKLCF
jgi:hypothetical protein